MPAFRPRPVRHNNDVFAGRRGAFPPVGQVEEVPSHDGRPDLGVAIEVPLEKGTDVVLRVRDEAIDRDHRVHEYSALNSMMFIEGGGITWRHFT